MNNEAISLYDRLTISAAKSIGINLTYSNNSGQWSRGEPYTKSDISFDPIDSNRDCLELACYHKLDVKTSEFGLRKARLDIVIKSAKKALANKSTRA